MFNFEDFKDYVSANIKDYLSQDYKDSKMEYTHIVKNGYEYDALIVRSNEDYDVSPLLNLTEAYNDYLNGVSLDNVIDKLADVRMNAPIPSVQNVDIKDFIMNFDNARARLSARLINTDANRNYLSDKPHKETADLSVMYTVVIKEDREGLSEAIVTNDLMNMWGVSVDEIHDIAMNNLSEKPIVFQNLGDIVTKGMLGEEVGNLDIDNIDVCDYTMPFFVLSNKTTNHGAVFAVEPHTMDRITESLGDVYILPSSVQEVLIVPQSFAGDVNELAEMVRSINSSEVSPQEVLSGHIYSYDKENKMLQIVDDMVRDKDKGFDR